MACISHQLMDVLGSDSGSLVFFPLLSCYVLNIWWFETGTDGLFCEALYRDDSTLIIISPQSRPT